jgi:preprotein translocase subunit SecA
VLIGTVSIAKNELLSQYLHELGVPHTVLNAKNNEAEAAIIAAAGHRGAVTLATNIAGRGTDIVLEEGVDKLGGLHVLGTERHESRRIDNQLRGRSGRQGDPGSSQFYESLEDDLMRIFGSERIAGIMDTLGLDEETPIENKLVSRSLESAQKKVEGHNFDTRKQLVEYDDVMNRHREVIYSRRRKSLAADSLREDMIGMIRKEVEAMAKAHTDARTGEVDHDALRAAITSIFPVDDELADRLGRAHSSELADVVMERADELYSRRAGEFTPPVMTMVERYTYINALDRLWIEHLEAMDSLRNGIGLRAIGQKDPLVEYKREGFRMFQQLLGLLDAEVATTVFKVELRPQEAEAALPVETALTRAAGQATTNVDGIQGTPGQASRAERRAAAKSPRPAQSTGSAKKRKKKSRRG